MTCKHQIPVEPMGVLQRCWPRINTSHSKFMYLIHINVYIMFYIVHKRPYSTKIAKSRDLSAEGACLIIAYLMEVQPVLPTGTPVLKFTGIYFGLLPTAFSVHPPYLPPSPLLPSCSYKYTCRKDWVGVWGIWSSELLEDHF